MLSPDHDRLIRLLTTPRYTAEDGTLLLRLIEQDIEAQTPELLSLLVGDDRMRAVYFEELQPGFNVLRAAQLRLDLTAARERSYNSLTAFGNDVGMFSAGRELLLAQDVVLEWPFKDAVLEGGMRKPSETNRDEALLHRTLDRRDIDTLYAPKALRNARRYRLDSGTVVVEPAAELRDTDNLILRANNLVALHALRQRFAGKVKLIYIDPPYNTHRNDFAYNDRFRRPVWLTFMRDRLQAAWDLLQEGGVLCVQIDIRQEAYLKILMDELLGEQNLVQAIRVRMSAASGPKMAHADKAIPKTLDTIYVYCKGRLRLEEIPAVPKVAWPSGYSTLIEGLTEADAHKLHGMIKGRTVVGEAEKAWAESTLAKCTLTTVAAYAKANSLKRSEIPTWRLENAWRIVNPVASPALAKKIAAIAQKERPTVGCIVNQKGKLTVYRGDKDVPRVDAVELAFALLNMSENPADLWTDVRTNDDVWQDTYIGGGLAKEGGVTLADGKKPEKLLARLITMFTRPGEIVLDYHLGSGTTAAVAHKLGRRYIGVEQLDYGKNSETERLKKVLLGDQSGISKEVDWAGGGSFVLAEFVPMFEALDEEIGKASAKRLEELRQQCSSAGWLSWRVSETKLADWSLLDIKARREALRVALDFNQRYALVADVEDARVQAALASVKPADRDSDVAFTTSFYAARAAGDAI